MTSEWRLEEFRRVSLYPKLRKCLQPVEAGNLTNGLRHQALVLDALPDADLSDDPVDNPLLAMATAYGADYLISGEKRDVLSLNKTGKTRILTVRWFLTVLKK